MTTLPEIKWRIGTPPTEAEIREILDREFADDGTLNYAGRLGDAFADAAGVVDDALYDCEDFRTSEQDAFDEAMYQAVRPIRERAIADTREALVAAVLRFAAEHPDAPRRIRDVVDGPGVRGGR